MHGVDRPYAKWTTLALAKPLVGAAAMEVVATRKPPERLVELVFGKADGATSSFFREEARSETHKRKGRNLVRIGTFAFRQLGTTDVGLREKDAIAYQCKDIAHDRLDDNCDSHHVDVRAGSTVPNSHHPYDT